MDGHGSALFTLWLDERLVNRVWVPVPVRQEFALGINRRLERPDIVPKPDARTTAMSGFLSLVPHAEAEQLVVSFLLRTITGRIPLSMGAPLLVLTAIDVSSTPLGPKKCGVTVIDPCPGVADVGQ